MLTIFSSFRSFEYPRFHQIQWNAARSWTKLNPQVEVLIFGNDPGSAEVCAELGFKHIPDVELTQYGTPVLRDIIQKANEMASHDTLALVSGDIILFNDLFVALEAIKKELKDFCAISWKNDCDLDEYVNFEDPGWEPRLKNFPSRLSMFTSGDFFMFSKNFWKLDPEMPPLVTGRGNADSYLFWSAANIGFLVDATKVIKILHPAHDHPHVTRSNPELDMNTAMVGERRGSIKSTNWAIGEDLLIRKV